MIIKVKKRKIIDVPRKKEAEKDLSEILAGYRMLGAERSRGELNINDIKVSIVERDEGSVTFYIRIGENILAKMGWKYGDRIGAYYHDNSYHEWIVCKAANGYKIAHEGKQLHGRIAMRIKERLGTIPSHVPNYEIHKDHIKFWLDVK